jgi:hypothetical protein
MIDNIGIRMAVTFLGAYAIGSLAHNSFLRPQYICLLLAPFFKSLYDPLMSLDLLF